MPEKISRLRQLFGPAGIDAFYITNPENRYYLSGFTGSTGALLVTREQSYMLTDFRYTAQAAMESPGYQVIEVSGTYAAVLFRLLKENCLFRLGLEGDHQTCNQYFNLSKVRAGVEIKPLSDQVEQLRMLKDESEIGLIEKAVSIADLSFAQILPLIKPGVTEQEIALQLEYTMRRMGADGPAFKIIVASGVRSALPHGVASAKTIAVGDLVTFDFGAVYQGYHSDITRTVVINSSNLRQKEIYKIVLEAQMNAIAAVKAGVCASDVDWAARSIIEKKGYGECFGHSTGHGLGLGIHENPSLAAKNDTILEPGMVVTIEPGIYIRNWGGVRIEDTVVVEDNGCRILTKTPKEKLLVL
ncbi:MAG: Xaa-Pro peptidase family protein [Desulfotomaculaceae bacterium]|nr:Xaa-Pro peptidase family protein [Desulfotomaculaceae bacterium]